MKTRIEMGLVCLLLGSVWSAGTSRAQGIILPDIAPEREYHPPLLIERHRLSVHIQDAAATTRVEQVFANPYGRAIEGTYYFSLPPGAAVTDFALSLDGRRWAAEMLEAREARRIYESIVRRARDPGLLEYVEGGLIRARVFPIPAGGERKVDIEYTQSLPLEAGLLRYEYPLRAARFWRPVGPPGPLPVQHRPTRRDHQEQHRRLGLVGEFVVDLHIEGRLPVRAVYSPTYDLDVRREQEGAVFASYEQANLRPDRDLIVYIALEEKDFGLHALAHRRYGDEDGFLMLMLAPRHRARGEEIPAKDVVFVLDTSGSMSGDKLEQAKAALRHVLESLSPEDRFNLIAFSTLADPLAGELLPATERERRRARDFIDGLQARGGTNIHQALREALAGFDEARRPRMLLFLTDGLPTVGETDVDAILKTVDRENRGEARLFVWGVGYDVNTRLLDSLAKDHHGAASYVQPREDIEEKVSALYDRLRYPALRNVHLDFDGIGVRDLYPYPLPDLFYGETLLVFGRYRQGGELHVRLAGDLGDRRESFDYRWRLPERERDHAFIPRLWATRKIGFLLGEIRRHGEDRELREEVVRLAQRYGIVTPYTSFLVTEDGMREERLADLPMIGALYRAGRAGRADAQGGMAGMPGPVVQEMLSAETGQTAVDTSIVLQAMEGVKQEAVARAVTGARTAGGKTFHRRGDVWVDSAWPDSPGRVVRVRHDSDAYWDLALASPELARYLGVAEQVRVWLGEMGLEIGAEGASGLGRDEVEALVRAAER